MVALTPPRDGVTRELRRADFHDRYVIGEDKVYGLGSSLNGVGKSMTTLIDMPDMAARTIRAEVEALWAQAEVVMRTQQRVDEDDDADPDDGHSPIRVEDGRFVHDGCPVRHRSEEKARRCAGA